MSQSEYTMGRTTRTGSSKTASTALKHTAGHSITMASEDRMRMIAERAYFKAELRGFQGGTPEQDWYEAELEIGELLSEPEHRRARSHTRGPREGQRRRRHREAS